MFVNVTRPFHAVIPTKNDVEHKFDNLNDKKLAVALLAVE